MRFANASGLQRCCLLAVMSSDVSRPRCPTASPRRCFVSVCSWRPCRCLCVEREAWRYRPSPPKARRSSTLRRSLSPPCYCLGISADCDCGVTDYVVTMQTLPGSHTLVALGATVSDEEVDVEGCLQGRRRPRSCREFQDKGGVHACDSAALDVPMLPPRGSWRLSVQMRSGCPRGGQNKQDRQTRRRGAATIRRTAAPHWSPRSAALMLLLMRGQSSKMNRLPVTASGVHRLNSKPATVEGTSFSCSHRQQNALSPCLSLSVCLSPSHVLCSSIAVAPSTCDRDVAQEWLANHPPISHPTSFTRPSSN